MKKFILATIVAFLMVGFTANAQTTWDGTSATSWTKGSGTKSDPYQIESAPHLAYLATSTNAETSYEGKYFLLTTNLDLNKKQWTPIGLNYYKPFEGNFDGNGKTIANLYINSTTLKYAGLFGYAMWEGEIKGIGIVGESSVTVTVTTYGVAAGGIVGYSCSTISNCYNTGSVSSSSSASVSPSHAGGIVGYSCSTISNCYNTGSVSSSSSSSSDDDAGGIAGTSSSTISNCYNTGSVSSSSSGSVATAGGIVGESESTISNCYNTGSVSSSSTSSSYYSYAGGIVGCFYKGGTISNCYNTGSVSSSSSASYSSADAGGIAGRSNEDTISNCYNTGSVSSSSSSAAVSHAGGIVGYSCSTISNCYNTGSVSSSSSSSFYSSSAGGIVGCFYKGSTISNCYNTGSVSSSSSHAGGIVGYFNEGTISNCCKLENMVTIDGVTGNGNEYGTVKTSEEMKTAEFVALLDNKNEIKVWSMDLTPNINNGYPILKGQIIYTITTHAVNGTITGGGTYARGATAILTAIANAGYHFTKWSDNNTDNPRQIMVTNDATYTAVFTANSYTITTNAVNGTVTGGGTYTHGATATLTATANTGYHFTKWSDGDTENPRTITVTGDATYTAEFTINSYTITTNAVNGTITGGGTFDYNSKVTLTATANEGYHFTKWSDNNTDNPRTITVTGDATYTAEFAANSYVITIATAVNGTLIVKNGTTVINSGDKVAEGTELTVEAKPAAGYKLVSITVDGAAITGTTVKVEKAITIAATFELIPVSTYAVTITAPVNGTLIVKNGTTVINSGDKVEANTTLTIETKANEGYILDKVTVDGVVNTTGSIVVTKAITIAATFIDDNSVEDVNALSLKMYPNPVNNILHIEGEYNTLEIYNVNGKLIMTADGENQIDVSSLTGGVYIIKATGNNSQFVNRLIKK